MGLTAVHLALLSGHADTAKELMNADGAMDIRVAAGLSDPKALQRYIDLYRQTDIYMKKRGGAALVFAVTNNQREAFDLLLKETVNVDQEVDGRPAIYHTAVGEKVELAEQLLKHHANANIRTDYEEGTLLHHTVWRKNLKLVVLLSKYGDVEALDFNEETPMHNAAAGGSADVIQALLDAGAKVDVKSGKEGQFGCGPPIWDTRPLLDTPLHKAVIANRPAAVALLLKAGAPLDAKNREGLTSLDLATEPDDKTKEKLHLSETMIARMPSWPKEKATPESKKWLEDMAGIARTLREAKAKAEKAANK